MRDRLAASFQWIRDRLRAMQWLIDGRLARVGFLGRIALYFGLMVLLGWPATTFLQTSSKTVRDLYYLLSLITVALCLLGIVKAYTERLRDAGLSQWWAPVFLIAPGAAAGWLSQLYVERRISEGTLDDAPIMAAVMTIAFGAPLVLALWRESVGVDQPGASAPTKPWSRQGVELLATGLALLIVIPTSIYAGLFQDGVWVGRTYASMPLMDSGRRHKFLKCWNLKGVGAGSGDGSLSGIYRDAYGEQVVDFFRGEDEGFDFAFVGGSDGRSFREQGFQVAAAGIADTDQYDLPGRFMINAAYQDGSADSVVNYTTFAFSRSSDSFRGYHVVMTVSQSLPENYPLQDFPRARAKVMIGDCMRTF